MKRAILSFSFIVFIGMLTACSPRADTATTVPTLVAFQAAPPTACPQEEILPTIKELKPAEIKPGTEVTVVASGGYFRDTCGGVQESARTYKIYLDDEPAADMVCYVNHCEGKLQLPATISPGAHCLGVQKGTCQMKLDVRGD